MQLMIHLTVQARVLLRVNLKVHLWRHLAISIKTHKRVVLYKLGVLEHFATWGRFLSEGLRKRIKTFWSRDISSIWGISTF